MSILFIFRRLVFFRHIRSRERILFGRLSERGCLPRALESTGNDFLANFQRVRRLIFSLRAIRLQRIISVDTPFSPFFLPSLPFLFSLFFPRSDFIVKRLVRFNRPPATTHSREAKYFHTPRQNCFRTWRSTNTLFGICCNFHSNNVSVFYE